MSDTAEINTDNTTGINLDNTTGINMNNMKPPPLPLCGLKSPPIPENDRNFSIVKDREHLLRLMFGTSVYFRRLPHGEGLPVPSYAHVGDFGIDLSAAISTPIVMVPGSA